MGASKNLPDCPHSQSCEEVPMDVAAKPWMPAAWLIAIVMAGCQIAAPPRPSAVCRAAPAVVVPVSATATATARHGGTPAASARESAEPVVLGTAPDEAGAADTRVALASHESESLNEPVRAVAVTLDQAIAISLDRNPNLVTLRASEPVAHAAYHVAETYPWNPNVQVEVLPYTRNPDGTGEAVSNYVLLMQTLELAHQRRHREAAAAGDWSQTRWNIIQAELANVAQTERLYFAALYQRELRDLAQRTASLNEDLMGIVQRRFEAALATAVELTTARVTARQSREEAALAEANFQTAVLALRRQLNLSSDEPLTCVGQFADFDWRSVADGVTASAHDAQQFKVPADIVATLADERPDVRAAQAGVSAARANADLARANRIPNVDIGPVYLRDEAGTVFAGFQTQMNLPVWDTGAPLARQREAEFRRQLTALEQARANAKVEAETAIERYERARQLTERERAASSHSISDELRRITQQYEAGQAGILNVFAVQNALLQERRAYLDLLNELAQAASEVTLAAGLPPADLITTSPQTLPSPEQLPVP